MADPRFAMLRLACDGAPRSQVAVRLGVSAPVVSQVLNGSGAYGSGKASTERLFVRVESTFGHWACPHLTEQSNDGMPQVITAARCRELAHRPAPTSSPRDLAHWQACRKCPHMGPTAPPVAKPVVPRKPRPGAADPARDPDPTPAIHHPAQEGPAP
jgi:hypothetical protein